MNVQYPQHKTFADRLQYLLSVVRHPSRREYTVTEVAKAITDSGYPISRGYLSALKEGLRPAPSKACVNAIAGWFGVPSAYFYDDEIARWVEREIELVSALRDSPIRHISLHCFGLSLGSLRVLTETIKQLRQLEGLPESTDGPVPKRKKRVSKRHASQATESSQEAAPTRS